MTFATELSSWFSSPKNPPTSAPPKPGDTAPSTPKLPLEANKRTIIAFLRHCGCPFAEKTFVRMREAAKTHQDIDFIAVSHSNQQATENWLKSLPNPGSEPSNLKIVVDDEKEVYAAYGLGASSFMHVLAWGSLQGVSSAKKEGFDVRSTESGSRWQTSGTYAIGQDGNVKFGGPAKRADDVPDFEEVVKKLSS